MRCDELCLCVVMRQWNLYGIMDFSLVMVEGLSFKYGMISKLSIPFPLSHKWYLLISYWYIPDSHILAGFFKPRWGAFVFKCKLLICTHLGGAFLSFRIMSLCKIFGLSCKSYYCHLTPKRGRLKEHSVRFCVLVNNSRIILMCAISVDYMINIHP